MSFICSTPEQKKFDGKRWQNLNSYEEALCLSLKRINGISVFSTPFQNDPFIPKEYLRPYLLQMHTYGLLPVDFKSHREETRRTIEVGSEEKGYKSGKEVLFKEEEHKGSIKFIVSKRDNNEAWKTFQEKLCQSNNIEVYVYDFTDNKTSNLEKRLDILVRHRQASTLERLYSMAFTYGDQEVANCTLGNHYKELLGENGCQAILDCEPIMFLVYVPDWDVINDKEHLQKIILAAKVSKLSIYNENDLRKSSKNTNQSDSNHREGKIDVGKQGGVIARLGNHKDRPSVLEKIRNALFLLGRG